MLRHPNHGPKKILVTCPACRHQQHDYPSANATYCQQCGERIPLTAGESPRKARRAYTVERRTIICQHCHHELQVHHEATAWQCAFCSTYLDLRNHQLDRETGAAISTYGDLEIGPRCLFSGSRAEAENIRILGRCECKLQSRGSVTVGGHAKLYGGAEGGHLHVSTGATLYSEGPLTFKTAEIHGKVETRQLTISGRLQIHADGHVATHRLAVGEINVHPGGKLLARVN
ncbi:MAG: polymer-forming cytoskeletal protein [Verrucomicrobiales bacterium]|jgi:ribosomal protein S27E/cytoskeletal protein CcmA (bactofilin family)|nr:polymer-forming cytoskeletal protein [Verrucomicrobiales bacterium]